jgi:hypothetical protein
MDNRNLNRRGFFQLMGAGFVSAFVGTGKPTNNVKLALPPTGPIAPQELIKETIDLRTEVSLTIDFRRAKLQAFHQGVQVYGQHGIGYVAGVDLAWVLMDYLRSRYSLLVGNATVENAMIEIGSALPLTPEGTKLVRGRCLINGLPKQVEISSIEVRDAIVERLAFSTQQLALDLQHLQDRLPEEVTDTLRSQGIILRGDFPMLKKLDQFLQQKTGFKFTVDQKTDNLPWFNTR